MLEGCIPLSDTMLEAEGNLTGQIVYGVKGADGKTPQRGVDYWTEEDRESILQEVLTQVPALGQQKLELVEVITLTEDTSSILRSARPDGSPYRFKSIFAMINMFQTLSNKWVQMAVTYDRDLYGTGAYVVNEGIHPNKRIAWHKGVSNSALGVPLHLGVLELDGVVFHLEGMGSTNSTYHNTTNLSMANALFYNVHQGQIQSLEINSEVPLVANTKIYLFGVSA